MIRFLQIMALGCIVALFTGCNGHKENEPIWKHTKITDLAPAASSKRPTDRLKITTFNIFIFQMPAKNLDTLKGAWQILYTRPLKFNDYAALRANSFSIGFGQNQMWDKIADLLRAADAERIETVTLLLSDNKINDVAIAPLYDEQTISYVLRDGSLESATMGPGIIVLRVKTEKIPGSRGVCKFDALPVFYSPVKSAIPQLAARDKSAELLFTPCRFALKMNPGDFLFLGPKRHLSGQSTLDSLFFSRTDNDDKPILRTYLIVCSRIID